jgi:starch synthase
VNIVYLTTEAIPFAKTGGLADVCGTLPARVSALGHRAAIIMPAFRSVHLAKPKIVSTDISFAISMSPKKLVGCRLLRSSLPDSDVDVWFIEQPQYFDRDWLYGTPHGDYPDNAERFAFFCRAALQAIKRLDWTPDVIHCNDWQSGLVPALMRAESDVDATWDNIATLMTVHNLAYQGQFPYQAFEWTGLDWKHFQHQSFEFYGHLNFLKTGIATADLVTTVSPRYSQEIRTQQLGCGLDAVLQSVADHLVGITNGIDESVWNPMTDPLINARYDVASWREGKRQNKRSLQDRFHLEPNDEIPLIGLVGRLAQQKGWDLILPVLEGHLRENRPTQWIVLGSGEARFEQELRELARLYPDRFALHVGFDDALAHQIEAGSDLFVMPSHYEPCGLNQLYSLRYGTIPIVTPTGGLADTVIDCNETSLADGTATGFHLESNQPKALDDAIGRALHLRYHRPDQWSQLVETGMAQDWSWGRSAEAYVSLYAQSMALRRQGQETSTR